MTSVNDLFNDVQPRRLSGTYYRIMMRTPPLPCTRAFRLALVCGAAVLCLPTTGFAGPIEVSTIASVAGRRGESDVSDHFLIKGIARFLGVLDNGGPGAYAGATYQADELAMLADDLGDMARADLPKDGNGPFERRERQWSDDRSSAASTVPEPSTLILFGTGLLVAAMWARRRLGIDRNAAKV